MSQTGKRNRGRGRSSNRQGRSKIDYQSKLSHFEREEDAATFWQRSNARLGIVEGTGQNGRAVVDYPCAVCGIFVGLERMPKNRHDVVCTTCKGALGGIYTDEDAEAAADFVKTRKSKQRGLLDGLPEMSDEDLEAVASIKALFDNQSAGRSGNRRRGPAPKGRKRRTPSSNQKGGSGNTEGGRSGQSRSPGRRRRRGPRKPDQSGDVSLATNQTNEGAASE